VRLAALVLAALLLAAPAAASERHPSQGELESELMCPICQGETLAQSDSPAAQRIKAYIARRITAGATRSEIKDELVAQWGQRILAAPPRHGFDLLAWVLPLVGLIGAAGVLGFLAWRWTRAREPAPVPRQWALDGHPLDPEEERRLDDELRRFDD
jgi:cytochrome c-type biogenesis protein CcmH